MIAVDTNILVRLLTGDEPDQARRARAIFESGAVLLAKTVVLETEWVLRRLYALERSAVLDALAAAIALPNVRCEDFGAVVDALGWAKAGMDFADALHLASAQQARRFATFDESMAKRAAKIAGIPVFVPAR